MKKKTCYIFAAGDFDGYIEKDKNDLIIAADAGYNHLKKASLRPDVLLGDFDTIGEIPDISDIIRFSPEKDYTDSELAIMEGIKRGYDKFVLCGAIGGKRIDHTLANISLAAGYAEKGYDITLTDGNYLIKALHNGSMSFDIDNNGFISVFSIFGKAEGVSETGLKYTLSDAVLDSSNPTLCVSNEFIGCEACISVKKGTIIIVWQKDINLTEV